MVTAQTEFQNGTTLIPLWAAVIGAGAAVLVSFISNFLAESYRRFRDGGALAGALAGELRSHCEGLQILKTTLEAMGNVVRTGIKLNLPEWPMPTSPVFEKNASKIGLLGPDLAGDIAYVYENIRAFRQNFYVLSKHHQEMSVEWAGAIVNGCSEIIHRAEPKAEKLLGTLTHRAKIGYLHFLICSKLG